MGRWFEHGDSTDEQETHEIFGGDNYPKRLRPNWSDGEPELWNSK